MRMKLVFYFFATLSGIVNAADPAVTIYNKNFAVVSEKVPQELNAGPNDVRFTDTTAHLEPESVILRDPSGKISIQILEQNYRNDPVSQLLLLSLFESKTIDFLIQQQGQPDRIVPGKIIRSGYGMHSQRAIQRYGQDYAMNQMALGGQDTPNQPMVEVEGQIRFGLPGTPLFPSLGDDTILKPMLTWKIESNAAAKIDAELAYVTGGMSWEADYNAVAPEKGDLLDLVGWVTMDNQSGKTFKNARIKLMAGDVSKIQREEAEFMGFVSGARAEATPQPTVTEKAFDEYHLYTLERRSTLRDRETKQVEFVRALGVKAQRIYVYDGALIPWQQYRGWTMDRIRETPDYGTISNPKVWVMREFKNSEANKLGMPLPRGRVRFYQQDEDKQLEFIGENIIDHTPKDETLRIYTGNAFDVVGERRRTDFKVNTHRQWADESFEIKLRNHKKEPVEIRVVEHLYRWVNWEITEKSDAFLKTDSQTIEFRVQAKPDEEKVITYKVHYWW
jgi:hypothetical protein